jgi:hypothetical protein
MVVRLGLRCGTVVVRQPPDLLREVRHRGGAHLTCDSGGRWVLGGCRPVKLLDAWGAVYDDFFAGSQCFC